MYLKIYYYYYSNKQNLRTSYAYNLIFASAYNVISSFSFVLKT